MGQKQTLPNSTAVLILGILSIITSCFLVGLILGIIGLSMGSKGKKLYRDNPDAFEGYGTLNAGYIMSIIGTVFGGLTVLYYLIWVAILGGAAYSLSNL
jgi:hypothetical protein